MNQRNTFHARRHFLATNAQGLGGIALAWLLDQQGVAAETSRPELEKPTFDLTPKLPHHEPQAKAMISFFMQGGPSHVDLFDPKPELDEARRQEISRRHQVRQTRPADPTTDVVLASPVEVLAARQVRHGAERAAPAPRPRSPTTSRSSARCTRGVNNHGPVDPRHATPAARPASGRPPRSARGSRTASAPKARTCPRIVR